ncbi:MAG: hypothetical protein GXO74_01060 [Calditrichaeota bacterium]|nr:hypothetical protein [Calditrichota bacterium]
MNFDFEIAPELKEKLKIAAIEFENLTVQQNNKQLAREINELCSKLMKQFPAPASAGEILQPMRELYRSCGIDPTKVRPSSEALFRRAVKGKGLYQVNSLVDTCNLCSLSFMLSIGLYDGEKIAGRIISVRLGQAGENYQGIGKAAINLAGRIALFDEIAPFGNPSADSFRTRITERTREALFVVFAPKSYDDEKLKQHIDFIEAKVEEFHAGVSVTHFV